MLFEIVVGFWECGTLCDGIVKYFVVLCDGIVKYLKSKIMRIYDRRNI